MDDTTHAERHTQTQPELHPDTHPHWYDERHGEDWSTLPFLGLVPHFHADPAEGVPLVSSDGHWWWDGYAWTPAPAVAGAGVD